VKTIAASGNDKMDLINSRSLDPFI